MRTIIDTILHPLQPEYDPAEILVRRALERTREIVKAAEKEKLKKQGAARE